MVTESRSVVAWGWKGEKGKGLPERGRGRRGWVGRAVTRRYGETFRDAGDVRYLYYSNGYLTKFITWDTLKTVC